jgi:hypothetical protein
LPVQDPKFILCGQTLDIVDTYSYLGIIFKYNGTFFETRKKLVEQANKALYCIYKLVHNESIPIDLHLKMVEPILLYGSKVWGYENLKVIEQIQLKFCKRILKVRNTTPHFMIYGELGRFLLEIRVKLRMIAFWSKLVLNENKLSSVLYRLMYLLKTNHQ